MYTARNKKLLLSVLGGRGVARGEGGETCIESPVCVLGNTAL